MDQRLNISMPTGLLEAVDDCARSEHLSRSGLIREALKAFMREAELTTRGSLPTTRILADRLRSFCAGQDDVVAAYLFGSAAKGTAGPLSDVDVGLLLDVTLLGVEHRGRSAARLSDLSSQMPAALGVARVDVVILNAAPVALAFRVVSAGKVVAGADDPARVRFEVGLLNRYLDYMPLEQTYAGALRERILRGEFIAR
jgi:predicted nucleotidyltransferase